jgi:pSer/pThr/pTyr-binding forkhead associated (FHA) protein
MTEEAKPPNKKFTPDWFMRGALTRLGDSFDRLTGRKWVPSSSLAASEIIERIKKLLDAEAIEVEGKGKVVPHHIQLKMQWDRVSDDSEEALKKLQTELTVAAVDHINDSLYYTYAPVSLEIKPDYFIEGVKLYASFDEFGEERSDAELNVTVPVINIPQAEVKPQPTAAPAEVYTARFSIKGAAKEKRLEFSNDRRCSVGRSGGNDLMLDDASVSKMHAALSVTEDGSLVVADTGSTNGTFINGQRIAYGKAMALVESDKVRFGQIEVTFERQPRPETAENQPANETYAGKDNVVEIDGFEFKKRETTPPATETIETPAAPRPDKSPEISNKTPMIETGEEKG